MANANEDLVRDGYAAFSAGDMEKLGSLYTDDFVHSVGGNNQLTGDYKGVPAAMGFYGQLFEQSGGTFSVDLKSVKADSDNGVVSVHRSKAERDGKKLDADTTLNFTVKDGKIARIDEAPSDQAAEDDFWGKA
ncbi:MAG: nuclear transport factor 2 family protein [Acidimicrobiia bacterium]